MSAAAAALRVARQKRRAISAFRSAGATTPQNAQRLEDLDIPLGLAVRGLISHKVLIEASEGRYYLDDANFQAHSRAARIRAIVIFLMIVIALALILIFK